MQYYKEAIECKSVNKYSDKAAVTQTIASCYSKIGDILSEAEDYNEALTCNEELKEMYNKIDDMLFNLGREDPAIIF
nr:hypothetical protein [Rickettsia conorii]